MKSNRNRHAGLVLVGISTVAFIALVLRYSIHLCVWWNMDRSVRAVPPIARYPTGCGMDAGMEWKEYRMRHFVICVPCDAKEIKSSDGVCSQNIDDTIDASDVDQDGYDDLNGSPDENYEAVRFSIPTQRMSLTIVAEAARAYPYGHMPNTVMKHGEGLVGLRARCLETSSADFRWSDTVEQVLEFGVRSKLRECMITPIEHLFVNILGVEVLVEVYPSAEFVLSVECPSVYAYQVYMTLPGDCEGGREDGVGFLCEMARRSILASTNVVDAVGCGEGGR